MLHHRTYFPLIVVALSLVLGGSIYSLFKDRAEIGSEPSAVTSVEYQANVHAIALDLRANLTASADQNQLLEDARDRLLDLVVPAEYKDVHLEMIVVLSQWLSDNPVARAAAQARWQALVEQYPWIE